MADSSVAITAGAGTPIDTRTTPGGDHRQVVTVGDPATDAVATVNSRGALLVQGPQSAATTLAVTTSSSTTGAIAADGYNIAMVSVRGTHAGVNLTWEISDDGTNWFPVQAQNDGTGLVGSSSGVITTNASLSWTIPIGAATHMRVRSTAYTSGTATVSVSMQTMPYEPIPSVFVQGTVPVSGTVTATASGTYTTTPTTPTLSAINSAAAAYAGFVKASAGTVYSLTASNVGAAVAYVKLYNKASAPVVASDVPVLTIPIPAGGLVQLDLGAQGVRLGTGIAVGITGGSADTDATAVAAAQVKVLTSYI